MTSVRLDCDDLRVDLAPEAGGGVARFTKGGMDVFRPARDGAVQRRDPLGLSCFPMTPYVNRVAHGRFAFDGRQFRLPRPEQHALHAFGWMSPWRVAEAAAMSATLVFEPETAEWPWRYRSIQKFDLLPDVLEVELSVHNLDTRPMPASLGLHPYFPDLARARLQAISDGMWETDAELIPRRWVPDREAVSFNQPCALRDTELDNCFTGFGGDAVISWTDTPFSVAIVAPACRFMQVFTRSDDGSFCVEAQTAMPDAFNRPDQDTGVEIVPPGGRFACRTRFELRTGAAL